MNLAKKTLNIFSDITSIAALSLYMPLIGPQFPVIVLPIAGYYLYDIYKNIVSQEENTEKNINSKSYSNIELFGSTLLHTAAFLISCNNFYFSYIFCEFFLRASFSTHDAADIAFAIAVKLSMLLFTFSFFTQGIRHASQALESTYNGIGNLYVFSYDKLKHFIQKDNISSEEKDSTAPLPSAPTPVCC